MMFESGMFTHGNKVPQLAVIRRCLNIFTDNEAMTQANQHPVVARQADQLGAFNPSVAGTTTKGFPLNRFKVSSRWPDVIGINPRADDILRGLGHPGYLL